MSSKDLNFDIKLIELGNYVRPTVREVRNQNFVLNGDRNYFWQYIIDRNNGSPTNSSINRSFADLIYGNGISATNAQYNLSDWAVFVQSMSSADLKKIACDLQIFGSATMEIIEKRSKKLSSISHVPRQLLAPEKEDSKGIINNYYFSRDWSKYRQNDYKPVPIPAFDPKKAQPKSIFEIRTYSPGKNYYSDPEYLAGLPYCELEEELANLHIRSVKQGLIAGYIINVPNASNWSNEQKEEFERRIKQKLTGTNNASQFVLSFNGRDVEITVTPFPVNDNIHQQWEFLVEESKQQILTSHRATSPSLVGIISSSGFSNTSDEMQTAEKQVVARVIKPKQDLITDALETVLRKYDVSLDLYFKTLIEEEEEPKEEPKKVEEEDDVELSKDFIDSFIALGEDMDEDWELIDDRAAKEITLSENYLNELIELRVSVPKSSDPTKSKSEQDTSLFKIRYQYAGNPFPEREFCKRVMLADKFYREEDLNKEQKTTPGMGPGGSNTYNPFLYKGGVNCKHWWQRKIFLKKNNKQISVNQAVKMILELEPEDRKEARWEQNPKEVAEIASPSNNHWKVT